MKKLFPLAIAILIFGCAKNNDFNTEVYVAGYTINSARVTTAKFWRNGIATSLTTGDGHSGAEGIALSGSSVIVCGWDRTGNPQASQVGKFWLNGNESSIGSSCLDAVAVGSSTTDVCILGVSDLGWTYWKNGNANSIIDTVNFQASNIAVNNGDVYVSGYTGLISEHQAQYWKNGVLTFTSPVQSVASAIAVSGNDVYLAGYKIGADPLHNTAVYWKNGTLTTLTSGNSNAKADAIFISGNDVYVSGFENNQAMIWKNGSPINLTDGSSPAEAMSISVKGNNVYAAGYEGTKPHLWKNGVSQDLADGNLDGAAVSIVVK